MLLPEFPNHLGVQLKGDTLKENLKKHIDQSHHTVSLNLLIEGDRIWMDRSKEAILQSETNTRYYAVKTDDVESAYM